MKVISTFLILFISYSQMNAQAIKSSTYRMMLKTLLGHTVPEISVEEAEKKKDVIWLDARERNEFDVSRIEKAIWVGYNDFNFEKIDSIDTSRIVIVYCSVGYRSEKVAEKLLAAGYDVSNLYGGIFEWKNQENDVVDSLGQTTEYVHAYNKLWGRWLKRGEKVFD